MKETNITNSLNSDAASSPSNIRAKLISYIRAGYPALYLVSPEEQRVEGELKNIARDLKFALHVWSTTLGLVDTEGGSTRPVNDPLEALLAIQELPEKVITVLRDFHLFLQGDPNPVLVRQFKDSLQEAKTRNKPLIILGCRLCLPPELEREITVVQIALPGKGELGRVLDGVLESAGIHELEESQREAALDAACGLSTHEAENAYALSIVESKAIVPELVSREKAQAIKQGGLMEVVPGKESLDSVGGLDVLKDWLLRRRNAFGRKARDYGLPVPKGLLMLGLPGTGKSLTAKSTAAVFGVPLLRLDMGRIFAGLVGQSEYNLRSALGVAEAIAPCVLWLDELEKGMAGGKSSGATDGGTTARVLGTFLSWMQEKMAPVFVVATANDVSQLPPEMLRAGRFDQVFFVDLPDDKEREAIWNIQIHKYGRDPLDFDLRQLARASEGLTGSEIEAVFVETLYQCFDQETEPSDLAIAKVLTEFVPLSKTMAEQIGTLRTWARGRARLATSPSQESKLRRIAV